MVMTLTGSVCLLVIINMFFTTAHANIICARSKIYLQATSERKMLLSSEYEVVGHESKWYGASSGFSTVYCMWEITTVNASDVVEFKIVHWFAPPTSDCSKDYLILSDDAGMWTRPLRLWCKNSKTHTNEVLKTRTATLSIEFYSAIHWTERVVFALEYWSAPEDIEIVDPVEYGPANYVLFVFSGLLGLSLLIGCVLIVFQEHARSRAAKLFTWRQKLMIRRKGISGEAIHRKESMESNAQSDVTSYIQLTETPTSIRCSSAWTPSPVTRISVSDTPTSGNFSL